MIYDVIILNVNALTFKAGLDLCLDETTFPFQGYGEAKTGLFGNIIGKLGVSKGAQLVLITDRLRPCAYVHHHKLHERHLTQQGPNAQTKCI
jgi:hypothetical protein